MTAYKTQLERVKAKLERDGFVTRNECLSQFPAITPLGARIDDLRNEGWTFQTENTGWDYVYRLEAKPQAKTVSLGFSKKASAGAGSGDGLDFHKQWTALVQHAEWVLPCHYAFCVMIAVWARLPWL